MLRHLLVGRHESVGADEDGKVQLGVRRRLAAPGLRPTRRPTGRGHDRGEVVDDGLQVGPGVSQAVAQDRDVGRQDRPGVGQRLEGERELVPPDADRRGSPACARARPTRRAPGRCRPAGSGARRRRGRSGPISSSSCRCAWADGTGSLPLPTVSELGEPTLVRPYVSRRQRPVRGACAATPACAGRALRGPVDNVFVPTEPPCRSRSSPSHPQAVPDPVPRLVFPRRSRHVLCSVRAGSDIHERPGAARDAEPPTDRRGRAPGPAARAGDPGRLHRRRPLQHPRRQRAAGEPRPAPGRAGAAHPVQLPARGRLGRAQAEGLRPRRDRPAGRRGDARGPVPVPD